jgi:hypothetical protein
VSILTFYAALLWLVIYIIAVARVASKGVTGYGTWKKIWKMGDCGDRMGMLDRHPAVFVRADSKGVTSVTIW